MSIKSALQERFNISHREYPQYRGFYDNARLVAVTRQIVGKGGVLFEEGDITIAKPAERSPFSGVVERSTVFSHRRGYNASVAETDLVNLKDH